ncbi:MAG: hypothetical protein M0R38_08185 [Bacteroidia bacterium]|nr:hypothetical protein [Bacteroidia bacterium]
MKDYTLTGWQDYWKIFDELLVLLKADNQEQIILEFKDARLYVNGLTDGWFEFKSAFEKSLQANRTKMTVDQSDIADFLILTLNKSLTNR